jgi:uncharacterized membrane protein YiaA
MKKEIFLLCYNLSLWGFLGFFVTLLFGFLACCANLSTKVFYVSLIIFAVLGITISLICVIRGCKKLNN